MLKSTNDGLIRPGTGCFADMTTVGIEGLC